MRLLQTLIGEAERRGYRPVAGDRLAHHGRWADRPWFGIEVRGHTIGITLHQLVDRVRHEPTTAELRRQERDSWYRIPSHDEKASDRFAIKITNGREYRQSRWVDGKTQLEEHLAQILQEIELRAEFEEERHQAELQRQAEVRRQWEEQRERAKQELVQHHYAEVLLNDARQWKRAALLRAYTAALETEAEALTDVEECSAAAEWITWCRAHIGKIDPLRRSIRPPDPPDPAPQVLAPFMPGLSPYGPAL